MRHDVNPDRWSQVALYTDTWEKKCAYVSQKVNVRLKLKFGGKRCSVTTVDHEHCPRQPAPALP